jgi:2-oxoglutarate-dependent dioxygenase
LAQASETADKLRQCSTYLKDSLLDRMINSPRTLAIASRLIGGEAQRYMPFTAVKAGRGGGEFHLHQDNNYTRHEPATGSINIWVALVDMSPENGCLRLAPGSHLGGQSQDMTSPDGDHRTVVTAPDLVVPMRMRAGDAVAFTRWTIHGSGPNRQPDPRIAYALQYHREDVQYLDKADDTWKSLRTNPRWSTEPLAAFGGEA